MVWVIPLAYGSLGAFAMVVQTILLREFFVVAAGNEISFGIAMGSWLLGVSSGSLAGAFFSRERSSTAAAFHWAALAMCLSAPLLLAGVRSLHLLGAMPRGTLLPLAKTLYLVPLLTLPFSFLSGFSFPLAARLRPRPAEKAAATMAGAFAWDSLGAMAGGLAYTFLLVGKSDPVTITALFALPLLAGAWAVARQAAKRPLFSPAPPAVLLLLAAIFSGGSGRCESWLVALRWQGISADELVAARDSSYQNLQLGAAAGQYSLFANGQLAAVFPDKASDEMLAAQLISQHPRPRDILVIGDVFAGLAGQLLRYPVASLTAVEIDEAYAGMIRAHLDASDRAALEDPRLRAISMDGRRFALLAARRPQGNMSRFDLVFIHQPDAWTAQLNRYYTREFFLDIRKILAPGGVIALRLASAENYASDIVTPYTASIYHTLKSVFPVIAVLPGMSNSLFASSSPDSVSADPGVLRRRYLALAPPPARLAAIFLSLYPAEKTAFITTALEANPPRQLNRDDRPVSYFLGSRLLDWSTGSPLSGIFAFFRGITLAPVLLAFSLLLLPVALPALLRRRGRPAALPAMLAAFSGGFAGLSFEITAIFIFQNTWGFVYQAVGMLIALFMLGLGAGAAWTGRWVEKTRPGPDTAARRLAAVQALIAALNLALLLLLRIDLEPDWPGQLLLASWLGIMGLLGGAILPLGLRVLDHRPAAQAAGFLNAADVLGGALGSLLMAAFFLPLLGTSGSLLLISFLALASAALLRFARAGAG
jgi:spermidine synthase